MPRGHSQAHVNQHDDNVPLEYFEARRRFTPAFLSVFDAILAQHQHINLTPSETLWGKLYTYACILSCGLMPLAIALHNWDKLNERQRLYVILINIAADSARVRFACGSDPIRSLQQQRMLVSDFMRCPVNVLEHIFLPQTQLYLQLDEQKIKEACREFDRELQQLERELAREKARQAHAEQMREGVSEACLNKIEHLLARLRVLHERERPKTILQRLRESNFSADGVASCLPFLPAWYGFVQDNLKQNIIDMTCIVDGMTKHSVTREQRARVVVAKDLLQCLKQAQETLLNTLHQPNRRQRQIDDAAKHFIQTCQQAIAQAKPILEQDSDYDWPALFADIKNILMVILSCGLSYAVTRQFRLFTPDRPVEKGARRLVALADELVQQSNATMFPTC